MRLGKHRKYILIFSWLQHSFPQHEELCRAVCLTHVDLCKADCFLSFMEKQLSEKLLLPLLCLYNVLVGSCCIVVTSV